MTQPPGDPTVPVGDPTGPEPVQPQVYRPAEPAAPPVPPMPTQPMPAQPAPPQWYPPTQGFPAQEGFPPQPYPPSPGYPQPYQPYPANFPPPVGPTGYPLAPPPPTGKKRSGWLIGILTGVFVLLLAGGGVSAYLLATQNSGTGQPTAQKALDGFLTAVYTNHDATAAAKYVCPQARDQAKISAKVNEIRQRDSAYELPKYSWNTFVAKSGQNLPNNETVLRTTVTVRTATEQHAEQPLEFTMVDRKGWWVCEVKQGS